MKNLENYFPGKGCQCFADGPFNCGCDNVDWTSTEVYVLRNLLERIYRDGYLDNADPDLMEEIKSCRIEI